MKSARMPALMLIRSMWLPRVLEVDAVVAVANANVPDRCRVDGLPVKPDEAGGGIGWVDLPMLFKDEPVIHGSVGLVTIAARRTEEPGLELVGAGPLVLEERHVGAEEMKDAGCRLIVCALFCRTSAPVPVWMPLVVKASLWMRT